MAVDLVDDVALKDEAATQVSPRHRTQGLSPARKVWRYVAMPLFLTIVLVGFYLYISGQELDTIEARQLTRPIIQGRLTEHIYVSAISTFFVVLLAVPLGILATRPSLQRFTPGIIGLGNFGQAIPSLGMLTIINLFALTVTWLPSTGTVPAVLALVAYSTLPILRNTWSACARSIPTCWRPVAGWAFPTSRFCARLRCLWRFPWCSLVSARHW